MRFAIRFYFRFYFLHVLYLLCPRQLFVVCVWCWYIVVISLYSFFPMAPPITICIQRILSVILLIFRFQHDKLILLKRKRQFDDLR